MNPALGALLAILAPLAAPPAAPASEPAPVPLVAVDAGHTAAAPGATSARGVPERTFNLAVASRLVAALRAEGLRAVLLGDGVEVPTAERAALAARLGAAALVSIHHDSVQPRYLEPWAGGAGLHSERFRGFSLFYSGAGGRPQESLALARRLGDALLGLGLAPTLHHAEPIEGEGRPLVDPARGVYRYDGLVLLRTAPMPAVLVECGVLVHRDEELLLASPERQERVARALAAALAAALRVAVTTPADGTP
jgi:N-acetylmuramoyl-L-alanine amidase